MMLTSLGRQTVLSLGPLLDASAELADIRAAENAVQAKDETRASERAALDGEVAGECATFCRLLSPVSLSPLAFLSFLSCFCPTGSR